MVGLGDIEAFFSLRDRFKKWRKPEPIVTNTAQRFIRLFEAHGIARGQIPRIFGYKLTIHQVEDETELLKALDCNLLQAAAMLFGIKLEWLEGGTDELYELRHFYKQPKLFGDWMDSLLPAAGGSKVDGWLLTTKYTTDEYDTLILMREQIGELGEEAIYRYHFCELWVYGYWKCRADIAACIAQAWKRNCYVSGRHINPRVFSKVTSLKYVPDSQLDLTEIKGKRFNAEKLTTSPEFYSQALNEGQFGIDNAIALWLDYHQQSLMDSGFGDYERSFKKLLSA
ncbi:hypothetical protein JK628_07515 [Shewanella sp. KX20019]|uniref:hypothetical protein n=1 Tax=Shewanella sp. KX20019 TaxID=2803864 RepID=UPI00192725D1|nr:hypothetical protein [Shewanella sp. KX20019]QQX81678.1 hypothetical protein JK628_07515 [Shewanella sp. KX20019]